MQINSYFFKYNSWKYFFLFTGLTGLTTFAINYLFLTEGLYYQSYGTQLAVNRIAEIIELSKKSQWIGYVFIPIALLIRISCTSICIYIGCFLANVKVGFNQLFKVALLSDFVFVLAGIIKLVTLIFFKEINTISDLHSQPLSLLELFDKESIDLILIYPFSIISFFELLYWLVLARLLSEVINQPFNESIKTVASSYGVGMLLWVLFVMFLTVNLN